ncbi:hypothetical protein ABW636_04980 [Aquimarina sp. 2201CG1-2-11]|uniref:hypothetical protein n=1 Tax=Aquimarina discodermiae TaxID=3231043 RepID=UPI003462194D
MINRFVGFIARSVLGILALIGGIFVILYTMIWDVIREKLLQKKPVQNPCFEKVISNEDIALPKAKSTARL